MKQAVATSIAVHLALFAGVLAASRQVDLPGTAELQVEMSRGSGRRIRKSSEFPAQQTSVQALSDPPSPGSNEEEVQGATEVLSQPSASYLSELVRRNPKPQYPRSSRYRNEEGRVLLRVELGEGASGIPRAVVIEKSSGYSALDEAALSAVRDWVIPPPPTGHFQFLLPVDFSLSETQ